MSTGKDKAPNAYPGMPFNQQMSFPRELTLRSTAEGPRLFRYPIREIEKLYATTHAWEDRLLAPDENALEGIQHDLLFIELDLEIGQAKQVNLTLRGEEMVYDAAKQTLRAFGRTAPLVSVEGRLRLDVLLDRTSSEVFGNAGEMDLSGVIYPDPADKSVALAVRGGAARIRRLMVRELKSIWPDLAANP